jgi:hypothetical protein
VLRGKTPPPQFALQLKGHRRSGRSTRLAVRTLPGCPFLPAQLAKRQVVPPVRGLFGLRATFGNSGRSQGEMAGCVLDAIPRPVTGIALNTVFMRS